MANIERISLIDRTRLSGEFYLQSLFDEGYRTGLLSDTDMEKLQLECIELLAYKAERYNSGDSSSIRVEAAQSIMTSNLYTIGLWLKSYPSADDAVKALKETKIAELYANGRKRIDMMIKTAKIFHSKVLQTMIDNENYFYNATVVDGIKDFFKIYNPDFQAQEIHITADYPLCNPIKDLVGIEFIQKYLESIYYENMLCRNFLPEDIHHLLCGYDEAYRDLLLNIYEPVLATAVGCVMAGEDVRRLSMTEIALSYLSNLLRDKSSDEINTIFLKALNELKSIFPLTSTLQERYIKISLWTIASKVSNTVELQTLDKLFLISKYPENNPKFYFSYGDKMDNERYRKIIGEIMQCRYLSDKIAIIKKQIHSLADFEDILLDAELSAHEIVSVLHELGLPEIAALSKKYPIKSEIEAIELREQEQILSKCLHDFIASLSEEQQVLISKAVTVLDIG
ncbi:DUF6179 domain-containing protein [Pelosinus baikalensis]|uniref:DUF6179 domain-containing protein n=1 Tax=Pelosinus baikalensis TaxID=2892015 RepID=A0ABS8I0B2_9FIRM|nr:DUF6179 domain-containing protein [Pelosinus baikalensis]MCC5468657.1 DUF6179 domain-containing protein [Pelosinus baikalensis]